jgi:uncharacterized RDD family membrane protein YckC
MKIFCAWSTLLTVLIVSLPTSSSAQAPQAEVTNLDETTAPDTSNKASRRVTHHGGHEDITLIGNDIVIKEGETMHDVVIVGGSATVDGTVRGDFVVVLGSVTLGPSAKVKRGLTVVGGSLQAHPNAEIEGDRFVLGSGVNLPPWLRWPHDWFNKGLLLARPLPHQYVWSWVMAGLCLLTYLLISILFPQSIEAGIQVLEKRPGSAFLTGLLFVVLSLLLSLTVVLIPFLLCGIVAAFLFGRVILYRYAGQQLGAQLGVTLLQNPMIALVIGTIIFFLLYMIPVLGFIVWGAVTPLCMGTVLLAFSKRFRTASANGTQGQPVAVMSTPPLISGEQASAIPPGTGPILLPRVGFWQRFAATIIDAVLIGFLMALMRVRPPAFILIWTAYHIAMWTWKGTTIGGMVFGLKIVRTDGRAINFAVALVRALSAFLSAAAAFIGFFWAGWSAEKQSWHDKIAGTYVVKLPKGVSVF